MENEKSSIEILKSISTQSNWDIDIREEAHSQRYGHTNRRVVIKNPLKKDFLFVSEQKADITKYNNYSGIFYPLPTKKDYHLIIRKRDAIDKLSLRKNKHRFKTGSSSFDAKVYIETNNDIETHKLLSGAKTQSEIVEFLYICNCVTIGVNVLNPNFNNELKEKSFLSVFITLNWMLESELINKAFTICEKFKCKLTEN